MILTQSMDCELYPWQRQRVKQMAQEYAESAGINWHFNYRWMTISDENYLLAKLKYGDILELFGINNGKTQQKHP